MDISFNIAKGRIVELWRRVKVGDPANARLVVVVLSATGLEPDATLMDRATLAAIFAAGNTEATNTGYSPQVLAALDLPAFPPPDNTANAYELPLPNIVWPPVAPDGTGAMGKLIVAYDPDITGGTDADVIPLTAHDFPVLPVGDPLVATFAPGGLFFTSTNCPA